MKKMFDWDKFITEKIAVHCKTKNEANEFFKLMNSHGIHNTNTTKNYWDKYKVSTCYYVNDNIINNNLFWMFCDKGFYEKEGYIILEFSDYFNLLNEDTEPILRYGEIKFNGDFFIVKEKNECDDAEWKYLCDLFGLDHKYTERIVIDGVVKYFGLRK